MDGKRCAEPFNFLTNFSCGTATDSSIGLSWLDTAGSIVSRDYLIKWSAVSLADISNLVDGTPKSKSCKCSEYCERITKFYGHRTVAQYSSFFKIWSCTNSGNIIDDKLVGEPQTSCSTIASPCNFLEDFSNIPTYNSGSYQNRSCSDAAGNRTATDARTDQSLNGKALTKNGAGSVTALLLLMDNILLLKVMNPLLI